MSQLRKQLPCMGHGLLISFLLAPLVTWACASFVLNVRKLRNTTMKNVLGYVAVPRENAICQDQAVLNESKGHKSTIRGRVKVADSPHAEVFARFFDVPESLVTGRETLQCFEQTLMLVGMARVVKW
ncbi:hypothetical protein DER46DRAFT_579084 [Fusarium sp. MPI-SDFR-AT-0072]|nr:hypothetical protein DER46DRAFT_579084 [Fusarium sp. MPI-SDFR-AT-0072]